MLEAIFSFVVGMIVGAVGVTHDIGENEASKMEKSIAIIQLKKHMGLTVYDEAITTTIWLTRKEAEKLMDLLRIKLNCTSKQEG